MREVTVCGKSLPGLYNIVMGAQGDKEPQAPGASKPFVTKKQIFTASVRAESVLLQAGHLLVIISRSLRTLGSSKHPNRNHCEACYGVNNLNDRVL